MRKPSDVAGYLRGARCGHVHPSRVLHHPRRAAPPRPVPRRRLHPSRPRRPPCPEAARRAVHGVAARRHRPAGPHGGAPGGRALPPPRGVTRGAGVTPAPYARAMLVGRTGLSPVMVGRAAELDRLTGLVGARPDPAVALVAGEAGIGKTP